MRLRIVHTTGFEYDGPAAASYNEARLTPLTSAEQIVVHTRLDVSPTPWTHTYRDYFGTHVTAFEVLDPHTSLRVTSTATVDTQRRSEWAPTMTWEEIRDAALADLLTEYVTITDLVAPSTHFAERVRAVARAGQLPGETALAVCDLVNSHVAYRKGSTHVRTHAAEAWEQRAGVCQDMAHLVLGGLRLLGIPARYVSGYLHPRAEPVVGETVLGESHAWIEWYDNGWQGFDPTNHQFVGDRHVTVATGRDYGDVRPLGGVYSGGVTSSMFVNVEVTRLG